MKDICLREIYEKENRVYTEGIDIKRKKHKKLSYRKKHKKLAYKEHYVDVFHYAEELIEKRTRFSSLVGTAKKVKDASGVKHRFYINADNMSDAFHAMNYIVCNIDSYFFTPGSVYKYFSRDDDGFGFSNGNLGFDFGIACEKEEDDDYDVDTAREPLWKSGDYPLYVMDYAIDSEPSFSAYANDVFNEKYPILFVLKNRNDFNSFDFGGFGGSIMGGSAIGGSISLHDKLMLNGFKYIYVPKIDESELTRLFKASASNENIKISRSISYDTLYRDYSSLFDSEYNVEKIVTALREHKLLNRDKSAVNYKDFVSVFRKFGAFREEHQKAQKAKGEKNPWNELNDLVGNNAQKEELRKMVDSLLLEKRRAEFGLPKGNNTLHSVFFGAPGTSKTTFARLVAKIMEYEGIINTNNFKECKKSDIIGRYVGHTAANVDEIFTELADDGGGVLFLDEAYTYTEDQTCFDREAINCIVQNMENHREIMVIFAGYKEPMQQFLESNAGIRSRIGFLFDFPSYSPKELTDIVNYQAKYLGYDLPGNHERTLVGFFTKLTQLQGDSFGNGREARKLVEASAMEMASRLASKKKKPTKAECRQITSQDLNTAIKNTLEREYKIESKKKAIGF